MPRSDLTLHAATNWDRSLLNEFASRSIVWYGKLQCDIVGGGRSAQSLSAVTLTEIALFVEAAKRNGHETLYVLNGTCLSNDEFTPLFQRALRAFLEQLSELDVSGVIVSVPFLLKFVKRNFPTFKVGISKLARVNTVKKAAMWAQLGADQLCMDLNINRDFLMLERIRDAVSVPLVLLANDACLYQCPFDNYHGNLSTHASQLGYSERPYASYCSLWCKSTLVHQPAELLRARFIRPEDVEEYRRIGINHFKVLDRFKDTTWLVNAIRAYFAESYDGNLADILGRFETYGDPERHDEATLRPHIDNKALNGFIDHFKRFDCGVAHCGVTCRYCDSWATRAITWPDGTDASAHEMNLRLANLEEQWRGR